MSQIVWNDVDDYIVDSLIPRDPVLEGALKANRTAGLPAIDVSAAQGKFLNLLVRIAGARMVLEIGTLGGYSTIWMARGLGKGGRLVTLEFEPLHATVARENLAAAGLSDIVEVRVGRAIDNLPKIHAEGLYPFDLIFIDADKPSKRRLSRLGAAPQPARHGHRLRQRHPRWQRHRCVERRPQRAGGPRCVRDPGRQPAYQRHRTADRRQQGLRRLRHRHCRGVGAPRPRGSTGSP